MLRFNLKVLTNNGSGTYLDLDVSAFNEAFPIVTSNGLSNLYQDALISAGEGAVYDSSANTLTLPINILGFAKTANKTTADYSVGDTITLDFGSQTIYAVPATPRLSVDVSTLAGWANLSAGSHDITIVAKAAGFKDSAPSAAVQVTKAASTKTLKAGTYQFVANPQWNAPVNYMEQALDFMVSDITAAKIVYDIENHVIQYFEVTGNYVGGYNGNTNKWIDDTEIEADSYRTIFLGADQQVSADFYEWAITGGNLVKQVDDNGITTDTPAVTYSGTTFTPVSSSTSSQSQLVKSKVDAAISNGSNLQTALNSISPDIWTTLTEDFTSEFLNSNVRIRDIGDFLFTDTDITRLIINCEAKVYFFVMYYGESWMPAATFTNTIDLPSSIAEEGNAVAGFIMLSQVPRS